MAGKGSNPRPINVKLDKLRENQELAKIPDKPKKFKKVYKI